MNIKHMITSNSFFMECTVRIARVALSILGLFVGVKDKTMIFVSFGGRNYDDSPRALYEHIVDLPEFSDWVFYWALRNPEDAKIRGAKVIEFGTLKYWKTLLSSKVWITNGGIDKGINLNPRRSLVVNTWHGTPIKRIEGEENNNGVLKNYRRKRKFDTRTIRCCQSDYDKEIFVRVFNASENCFITCGLPRNDSLLKYSKEDIIEIKKKLNIGEKKKVLLYMPTYREYVVDEKGKIYVDSPISLEKWEKTLAEKYVLLVRAHYAVAKEMNLNDSGFALDVSKYAPLNDLYAISDVLISDYSSSFFDYAILGRPLLCYAYDEVKYERERGYYMSLTELPCKVMHKEDEIIEAILNMDYENESQKTKEFAKKYIPNEGYACEAITKAILGKLE